MKDQFELHVMEESLGIAILVISERMLRRGDRIRLETLINTGRLGKALTHLTQIR